jgi:hypothetical protein
MLINIFLKNLIKKIKLQGLLESYMYIVGHIYKPKPNFTACMLLQAILRLPVEML